LSQWMIGTRWRNDHVKYLCSIEGIEYDNYKTLVVVVQDNYKHDCRWELNYFLRHHTPLEEEE